MKRNVFLFFLALGLFLSGCTSTNINSPQRVQQTCTATPISSSESQEKQCCLKDTLVIQRAEEVCSLNDAKDSVSNASSTNVTVSPSVPLDFSRDYELRGRLNYQKEEIIDSREGCFGANCQVNNVYIGNANEKKFFYSIKDTSQSLNAYLVEEKYLYALGIFSCVPLILSIVMIIQRSKTLKKKSKNIGTYNILSPTEKADNVYDEIYKQLEYAIIEEEGKVNNIAISGPYGAGKSSVWQTFCEKMKVKEKKKIVEISLAKFNNPNENESSQTYSESEVECAIIQQFIFSKKYTDLKYSNVPRIYNLTDLKTILLTTFVFILFALIVPFANETILSVVKAWLKSPFEIGTIYIPLILSFVYILIFYAIQKINKLRISKINVKDLELTTCDEGSLFDKYINEIVYFFEATKCNCVVIEDLDRFDTLKYFTKLREINFLINNYPGIKENVKFVYLVKDDILTSEERTKFFDMIIPVIPVLNGRPETVKYIKDHFLRKTRKPVNEADKEKPFLGDGYLNTMAKYLSDLRLVKNCFNEFKVFKEAAERNHGELDDEKIFTLVLYKNINPKDYQNLISEEGVLYYCLNDAVFEFEKETANKGVMYFSQIHNI